MNQRLEAAGWILFTISGVFFVMIAIRDGDGLAGWSAFAWLLGVVSFVLARWGPFSR